MTMNKIILVSFLSGLIHSTWVQAAEVPAKPAQVQPSSAAQQPAAPVEQKQPAQPPSAQPAKSAPAAPSWGGYCREHTC